MLTEYIMEYAKARKEGDKKSMKSIERDLNKLGMDSITLNALADDVDNGYITGADPIA